MDRRGWMFCLAAMLLASASARAQVPLDLGEVIDKAIVAAGGADRLSRLPAQTWKSRITMHSRAEPVELEGSYAIHWPDKLRSEIKESYTLIRNGDEAWIREGDDLEELIGDRLSFLKEDMYVNWMRTLLPLKDKDVHYQTVPAIEVEGEPAVGVRVSRKGHRDIVFLFDPKSWLVVKVESKSRGMGLNGELANIESFYSDYKEVAGTQVPTRVKVLRDGELYMEIENYDIVRKAKLETSVFQKPE